MAAPKFRAHPVLWGQGPCRLGCFLLRVCEGAGRSPQGRGRGVVIEAWCIPICLGRGSVCVCAPVSFRTWVCI